MIKLAAFDWSGVISDDRHPVHYANMRLLETYGLPTYSFEEWLPRTALSAHEFMENHGVKEARDKLLTLYKTFLNEAAEKDIHPTVYSGAQAIFADLKKNLIQPLVILSSHPIEHLQKEAQEYGLTDYFDSMHGETKDKAVGLLSLAETYHISPDEIFYIGDTIYDIQSAKKAGVISAGISSGYHVRERLAGESPDHLFDTLSEVSEFLLRSK